MKKGVDDQGSMKRFLRHPLLDRDSNPGVPLPWLPIGLGPAASFLNESSVRLPVVPSAFTDKPEKGWLSHGDKGW
jgi:hypothetical protein